MIHQFTDAEYAVIYDSLVESRTTCRKAEIETPNIDSALRKLASWATPAGCQFLAVSGEDMDLLLPHIEPLPPRPEEEAYADAMAEHMNEDCPVPTSAIDAAIAKARQAHS